MTNDTYSAGEEEDVVTTREEGVEETMGTETAEGEVTSRSVYCVFSLK